jgi:hypothetical protein
MKMPEGVSCWSISNAATRNQEILVAAHLLVVVITKLAVLKLEI